MSRFPTSPVPVIAPLPFDDAAPAAAHARAHAVLPRSAERDVRSGRAGVGLWVAALLVLVLLCLWGSVPAGSVRHTASSPGARSLPAVDVQRHAELATRTDRMEFIAERVHAKRAGGHPLDDGLLGSPADASASALNSRWAQLPPAMVAQALSFHAFHARAPPSRA